MTAIKAHPLDAAVSISLHFGRHGRRASDVQGWAKTKFDK